MNDIFKQAKDVSKAAFANKTTNNFADSAQTDSGFNFGDTRQQTSSSSADANKTTKSFNTVKIDLGFNPEDMFKQFSGLSGTANTATNVNTTARETKRTAREMKYAAKSVRPAARSVRMIIALTSVLIIVITAASIVIPLLIYANKLQGGQGEKTGANSTHIETVINSSFSINFTVANISTVTINGSLKNNYDKAINKFTITFTFYNETDTAISTKILTKNDFASGEIWSYSEGNVAVLGVPVRVAITNMSFK